MRRLEGLGVVCSLGCAESTFEELEFPDAHGRAVVLDAELDAAEGVESVGARGASWMSCADDGRMRVHAAYWPSSEAPRPDRVLITAFHPHTQSRGSTWELALVDTRDAHVWGVEFQSEALDYDCTSEVGPWFVTMPIYDGGFGRPDGPGVAGDFESCGSVRSEMGFGVHAMPEHGADSGELWVFNPYSMEGTRADAALEDDGGRAEWRTESSWPASSDPDLSLGVMVSYRDGEPVLYCGS